MKKVKLNSTSIMRKRIGLLTKRQFICAMIAIIVAAGAIFVGCRRGNFETDVNLNVERTTKPRPTDGSTPASHTINDNFYFAMDALLNCKSFIGESHGTSTAAGVEQQVKAYRVVDGDKVYKESLAYSNFKKVGVEMYVSGDNYVLRETSKLNSVDSVSWPASPYKITEDGFLGKFGAKPNTITSYALNDKSILPSSEYLGEENGVYKFRYDLDPVEATPSIRKEMRTMAGTKTLPNFQSASLTVSIDKDWNVLQTETNSVYEVDMLGGVTAHEHIIETFRYGEEPKIPDEEVFTPYLSAEATDPAPEAATAMDYLTNGFTDYLGGQRALSVTTGEGSDLGLSGRVAINVNLSADNILDELEVRAQIDSLSYGDAELKDLFVGFNGRNGGEVYLTAGDLRAKLGINDVTALVGKIQAALAPSGNAAGEDGNESESLLGGLDFGSILDGAEPVTQDGVTLVPLKLSLAGMDIDVKMYFTEGETISLDHIDATVKSEKFNAALKVAPAPEGDTVNPIPADCLDIIPAINGLLGDDLAPTLAIKAGGINATVRADLASGAVDATLGGLKVKYVDKTAYLEYGDFKGKLAADDLTEITDKLLPIVQSIGGKLDNDKLTSIIDSLSGMLNGGGADLGSLLSLIGYNGASDLGSIITALVGGLETASEDGTLGISLTFGKIAATLSLTEGNGAYAFGGAKVTLGDTVIDITAADKTALETIETPLNDFHDITPILDIIGDDNTIKLKITVGETKINAAVNLADLTADVNAGDLLARYADGKIYLSYKGLNAYIATADFGSVMDRLTPILSSLAPNIADTLDNLGDLNIAGMLGGALKTITVTDDENGTTTLSLSIDVLSLGKFDIAVSLPVVGGGYTLGKITVSGTVAEKDLTITATPSAQEVTPISQENLDKAANILPILDIIGDDNTIKLDVAVGETKINAAVNLADLTADVNAGALSARYAEGKIYLSYKGLNAYIATSDFGKVMDKLTPILKAFAPKNITDALDGLGDLNIAGMLGDTLETITVTDDENGTTVLSLSIDVPSLGKFNIAVSLPVVNGGYTLGDITVSGTVAGKDLTITATPSTVDVPTISKENLDKAANILPILNIIGEDNKIKLDVEIGKTVIRAAVNLADLTADVKAGDLLARYADGKIYLSYKGLNAYIATDGFSTVMERLTPIISKLAPKNITDALDNLGDLNIAGMLGGALETIKVTDDENGTTTLSLSIDVPSLGTFDIAVSLPVVNGGYTLGDITVSGTVADKPLTITATPSTEEVTAISKENIDKAANILPILDIIDDDNTIKLDVEIGKTVIRAAVNLMDLTADVNAGELSARYADGKIYLSYKGLNAYIATSDFSKVMERLTPILSNLAPDIADTLNGLGDLNIAGMLGGALKTITVTDDENGTTTLSLLIEVPSLGKFDIAVSLPVVNGGYTLGKITVSGNVAGKDLTITATPSTKEVPAISKENIDKAANILPILDIIGNDNTIKLDVEIGKTVIRAAVNLADLTADVNAGDLLARYADGKIYLSYKGLNAYIATSDFSKVMGRIKPIISNLAPDMANTLGGLGDLNIAGMLGDTLKTITVTENENGITVLSLSVEVPSLGTLDIAVSLPVVGGGYTLGKITVSGTVADKPLTITATPSTKEVPAISKENIDKAADITGLLALIDGGNINLTATIGGTDIDLTLDLNTMTLYAATSGLVAKVDLREKTALATYSGIGVKLNLSDITSILKALEPTITKLMKDSGATLDVTAKLGDLANKLDIAAILGQIEFAEGDGDTLSSNLEIDGITVTLTLSTAGKKLTFAGATVALGGTEIAVTPSKTAVTFDGLADEKYIDLKTVADVFAEPLNALVTAKTVTIKPSGTITLSDRTYEITGDSEIVIGNIDDVENLMLSVYIKAHAKYLNADGTVGEESDHEIKFIYKRNDGGKKSGYLMYDDKASAGDPFEAQFTLDNLNATLENLKTIYNHIPELQTALDKYIPKNENNEFALPEIDVMSLIRSLTLEGEKLTAGLNLSALMAALPDDTVEITIAAENGAAEGETAAADTEKRLSLSIDKLSLGNIAINGLHAYASGTTDPRADAFTYTAGKNANDFSSINELTKALAVTTEYRHFNLSGNIDLTLLGKEYAGAISLEKLQIDVNKETGKTYFYAHIKRAEVKAILGLVNAWSDLCGDLELYFDGNAQMIYAVEHSAYDKHKVVDREGYWDKSSFIWKWVEEEYHYEYDYYAPEYKAYTLTYFTNNILEVLSDLLNFGSLITDNLGKTSDAKGGRLHLDQLIKSYAHTYDNPDAEINEDNATKNSAGKFDITLNLGSLTNDVIKELPITIKHDAKFELTSINANLTIFSVITVNLDITHNRTANDTGEYNVEQHSQSAVEQQAQKSEYVLVG